MRGIKAVLGLALFTTLTVAGCDRGPGPNTLAQAGRFELQVEEVSQLLAPAFELPNDAGVVQAVADFWIDYTLLAWMLNQPGEIDRVDLDPIVVQETSQETVRRLRDLVIQVDTSITDEELREIFAETRPADQVRSRHILLSIPPQATQAERDSIRGLAESLRERALGGESFAALAEEYSDDTGSAVMGGDLGFYGRGTMVPPFDSASFALAPGEISGVIETDFGLHVIRLEERTSPEMEELPYSFREQLLFEWISEAEGVFLDQLLNAANVQVPSNAVAIIREVAADPEARMRGNAASRPIATFEGGSYTAGEFRDMLLLQPAELRDQIGMATPDQLEGFARDLVRERVLLAEAARRGIQVSEAEASEIESALRADYAQLGELLGLDGITPSGSENLRAAVSREVLAFLERVVEGSQDLIPLAELAIPLRNHFSAVVSEDAVPRVMTRIEELRAEMGGSPFSNGLFPEPGQAPGPPDALETTPEAPGGNP